MPAGASYGGRRDGGQPLGAAAPRSRRLGAAGRVGAGATRCPHQHRLNQHPACCRPVVSTLSCACAPSASPLGAHSTRNLSTLSPPALFAHSPLPPGRRAGPAAAVAGAAEGCQRGGVHAGHLWQQRTHVQGEACLWFLGGFVLLAAQGRAQGLLVSWEGSPAWPSRWQGFVWSGLRPAPAARLQPMHSPRGFNALRTPCRAARQVCGTANMRLVDACVEAGVPRFAFISGGAGAVFALATH